MIRFSALVERLIFTPGRNGKLRLLEAYFRDAPDPDRGWAVAALTGALDFPAVKAGAIRNLMAERCDPDLFAWSYDYVGDLAETASLLWPAPTAATDKAPSLSAAVDAFAAVSRADAEALLAAYLDQLDASGRWALLKLVTGGFRIGVSARLAKVALARFGGVEPDAVEECWHALAPPYGLLFAWLDGRGPRPDAAGAPVFRPVMLAHPLEDDDIAGFDAAAYAAEWKWDGVRVQAVGAADGRRRLYTRTGDDIGAAFPDIVDMIDFVGVLDGELLVADGAGFDPAGPFDPADFAALQKRLNRKTVAKATLAKTPAFIRAYDLLFDGEEDLRGLAFRDRRARLEAWFAAAARPRFDLSALVPFGGFDDLAAIRARARADRIEGLMLKRWDSPYLPGRPKGRWWKWKRAPLTVDAVLMYAQRGHGGRSSFYSDFTFGCWTDAAATTLAPVGKAYSGFTNDEMKALDKWVRAHTVARYGPVREVSPGLVFEVAFDGVQRSTRHRSGVALRFPRISRIRWDKPIAEADPLERLRALAG